VHEGVAADYGEGLEQLAVFGSEEAATCMKWRWRERQKRMA